MSQGQELRLDKLAEIKVRERLCNESEALLVGCHVARSFVIALMKRRENCVTLDLAGGFNNGASRKLTKATKMRLASGCVRFGTMLLRGFAVPLWENANACVTPTHLSPLLRRRSC